MTQDDELLNNFLDESAENLNQADRAFIELEHDPNNVDIINRIFRPVHSMKGASAFFGLNGIKELSHHLENLLDALRKKECATSRKVIDLLLEGTDRLKVMIVNVGEKQAEVDNPQAHRRLIEALDACLAPEDPGVDPRLIAIRLQVESILKIAKTEALPLVDELNRLSHDLSTLLSGEAEPTPEQPVRPISELVSELGKMLREPLESGVTPEGRIAEARSLLMNLRASLSDNTSCKVIDAVIADYDLLAATLGFDPLLAEVISKGLKTLEEKNVLPSAKPPFTMCKEPIQKKLDDSLETSQLRPRVESALSVEKPGEAHAVGSKTMRVPEKSIDTFLSYVGELIVVQEMFNYIQKNLRNSTNLEKLSRSFRDANDSFRLLSLNLQKSLMEVRKVNAGLIVQKGPRIIRDIAKAKGKEIKVEIQGGELMIDKSLVETLDAPFTHMIRNAGDHGIEMPEAREKAGKPREGTINVELREDGEMIHLSVGDDGGGLNLQAIQRKAEDLGLVAKGATLEEHHIVDFIFSAGVSTAESVTDISGRGVGMDVVKRNIEEAGGKIRVNTVAGKGSTFTVSLPKSVSTKIIDGFLVLIRQECYVLPMVEVIESFRPSDVVINTIGESGETIIRRGEVYQVMRLGNILERQNDRRPIDRGVYVMLRVKQRMAALWVDEIEGTQQVVMKDILGVRQDGDLICGAALRGDQRVALILDTEKLLDYA